VKELECVSPVEMKIPLHCICRLCLDLQLERKQSQFIVNIIRMHNYCVWEEFRVVIVHIITAGL
jgi:hypothetical protein